jgi:acetyl-CoA acetyltransferase
MNKLSYKKAPWLAILPSSSFASLILCCTLLFLQPTKMISNNRIANLTNQVAPRNGVVLTPASCSSMSSGVGTKHPDDVVVISALRTPIGRANKGSFKDTNPDDLLAAVLAGVVDQSGIAHKEIGDVVVGNVQLGGAYAGPARMAQFRAGYPIDVPINAVNRQCSSGLQACANIAGAIKSGQIDCGVGCGVESMTMGGGVAAGSAKSAVPPANWPKIFENALARDCLTPMGVTAENIAERYGVTRAMQDEMGVNSHAKALAAQANGSYNDEIVSVTTVLKDAEGNEVVHAAPTPTFTVHAPTSQFDLPEGRSACTTIACEAAFRMTAEKDVVNATTFEDVGTIVSYIADGVAEYKAINANAPVEHMSCGEVMLMSGKYSKVVEQVVMVQGTTQGKTAFEKELDNAMAGAQEDKAPVCAVITKPPESVVVYCHQSGVFVLFDSHPRQTLGINGAYACGFATAASCAAFLRGIFPAVSGLGDSMMAQMYNSFEFTVLRRS